ncbi:hypothetical protein Acsp06_57230 [Actinomycetospora sp. NBRC 106375]|nr:hypothetical protein Acsp06_57230 [Actinomycetospora sp. NBRC 106375]
MIRDADPEPAPRTYLTPTRSPAVGVEVLAPVKTDQRPDGSGLPDTSPCRVTPVTFRPTEIGFYSGRRRSPP